MASSCWVPDPNKKEYKNWLTVGRAILTTQKGVAPLTQLHIESWHRSLLLIPRLSSCGPCICTSMTSTNCVPCRCIKVSFPVKFNIQSTLSTCMDTFLRRTPLYKGGQLIMTTSDGLRSRLTGWSSLGAPA